MGNDDDGENSPATMRVLVADADTEMLEAVGRAFDVDVATSKATCIDLLRANEFDAIVACERLTDGSGLELLSHVGQRWPNVVRILAIEPARRALLKGRLGPFKLFETIAYPIDIEKLEGTLTRAAEAMAVRDSDPRTSGLRAAATNRAASAQAAGATREAAPRSQPASRQEARSPAPRAAQTSSSRSPASVPPSSPPPAKTNRAGGKAVPYPPLPAKGSKIVPLGSPTGPEYRIVRQDYRDQTLPGAGRAEREAVEKTPTLQKKAAALAAGAMAAMVRYIKPQNSTPPDPPPKTPPRKKR